MPSRGGSFASMSPLNHIRVIEFCQIAAGPFAGMLLADMGADVIKVESPEGDGMRNWPPHTGGYSENFASLNRGKRSVVLDLKDKRQLQSARQLCLSADVVLENFRPGVMNRLGLGYEVLRAEKPALVYCSISAFGQQGPRAQEGGFDVTLQAIGGVMSVTGEPGGAPVKSGVPLTDFAAGLYAAFSIASSLFEGKGRHIDVPMLGTTLAIAALQTSEYFGSGKDPKKLGSAHPRNAPYQAFRCKDGYFVMAAGNDDLFRCSIFEYCPPGAKPGGAEGNTGRNLCNANGRAVPGDRKEARRSLRADQQLFGSAGGSAGGALRLGTTARAARRGAYEDFRIAPHEGTETRKAPRPGGAHRGGAQAAFILPLAMKRGRAGESREERCRPRAGEAARWPAACLRGSRRWKYRASR
jgi:crotonobetainyl-CoA:carnitine CoA-transferase CaiB-like acyl-CoA transferase